MSNIILDAVHDFDPHIDPKPAQISSLEYFLAGMDVIVNLPVGFGKSLIYQVLPKLSERHQPGIERPVVLVISPLNIIQTEQISVLQAHGVTAIRLPNEDECSDKFDKELFEKVSTGVFPVVFSHPEALFHSQNGRELMYSPTFVQRVVGVVIDECHIVETWGEEFRTAFKKLKTLPAVFEKRPILALSGTLTVEQLRKLPDILGLKNPVIVQESPDRKNIFLQKIEKAKYNDICEIYEDIYKRECDNLKKNPTEYPVTLLFMPLYYISEAATYLKQIFGEADISKSSYAVLYSRQDKAVIDATVSDLQSDNPRIRLVLTSSVAGMGFDPPSVTHVIHAKPPRSMSQYLQEIGRAGRRGQTAIASLYYNNKDIAKNLPGIQNDIIEYCKNNDKCLRELLLSTFGFEKTGMISDMDCCSFCEKKDIELAFSNLNFSICQAATDRMQDSGTKSSHVDDLL